MTPTRLRYAVIHLPVLIILLIRVAAAADAAVVCQAIDDADADARYCSVVLTSWPRPYCYFVMGGIAGKIALIHQTELCADITSV